MRVKLAAVAVLAFVAGQTAAEAGTAAVGADASPPMYVGAADGGASRHKARKPQQARDDICGIVNGWRAFPLRDARGYFDTRRVRCR